MKSNELSFHEPLIAAVAVVVMATDVEVGFVTFMVTCSEVCTGAKVVALEHAPTKQRNYSACRQILHFPRGCFQT